MLFSHVKISPLLWLHNESHLSYQKTIKVKWFDISLVFIIIIKRTLHGCLEIRNFSSCVEKIFQLHSKRNFVSPRGHVISSIKVMLQVSSTPFGFYHLPCKFDLNFCCMHTVSFGNLNSHDKTNYLMLLNFPG